MKIELSSGFRKSFKKLSVKKPEIAVLALEKNLLFSQEHNHPALKFHKLRGEFEGLYSFSVEYDIRIIVDMVNTDTAILLIIGTHDEVY